MINLCQKLDAMKLFTLLILISLFPSLLHGQVFYTENFGTGCNQGNLANGTVTGTGTWTVTNTGANGGGANQWFISATEAGMGVGNCGDGCLATGGNNRTLHVANVANGTAACFFCPSGDCGAAYADGTTDFGFCPGSMDPTMNKRAESPIINCSGQSGITLDMVYMFGGQPGVDFCTVEYFDGVVWSTLGVPAQTATCGGGQGLWTAFSAALPASANNNPNVKIGFRWQQVVDDGGVDPSFAVDDIELSIPIVLGVDMVDMSVLCNEGEKSVTWTTQNEHNSDYFNVYYSHDALDWNLLDVEASNNHSGLNQYIVVDRHRSNDQMMYYYIEQVDKDGKRTSYKLLSSDNCDDQGDIKIFPNPSDGNELRVLSSRMNVDEVFIFSIEGKQVGHFKNESASKYITVYPSLSAGRYLVKVRTKDETKSLPLIIH